MLRCDSSHPHSHLKFHKLSIWSVYSSPIICVSSISFAGLRDWRILHDLSCSSKSMYKTVFTRVWESSLVRGKGENFVAVLWIIAIYLSADKCIQSMLSCCCIKFHWWHGEVQVIGEWFRPKKWWCSSSKERMMKTEGRERNFVNSQTIRIENHVWECWWLVRLS